MNSGLCCWTSESDHVELQTGDARETDAQLKRGSETPHHPVGYDDDDRWEGWEQLLTGPQSMQGSDLSSQLRDAARLEGWLAGWLAGRTATWKTDWASWDGVYPPPTNPLTANLLGAQCRRQSSLPSAALLGVCSADSDWGALTLSVAWRTPVFLPTGLEDTEPWQIEEDKGTLGSGSLSLDVKHSDMFILCICCR